MTEHATDRAVVRRLTPEEARARCGELSEILLDCVEGGASVGFMASLARETSDAFWRRVADGVAAGERALLVAEDAPGGEIVGTVHLAFAAPENQPHRAEVVKMLVRRSARRRGLADRLMRAVEDVARECGKTLLMLDTVTSSPAERLYERRGWSRLGVVPGYALWPDGRLCDATFFYKTLETTPARAHGPSIR